MASTSEENNSEVTPMQIQQVYFEMLGASDWVSYEVTEHLYLQRCIGFALFGAPKEVTENNTDIDNITGYNKKETIEIKKLYKIILDNCHMKKPIIIIRTIFICCELKRKKKGMFVEPVFILKKCDTLDGCKVVIDKEARVYKSWELFLENNRLPKCVMHCPKGGRYVGEIISGTEDDEDSQVRVLLEEHESPACSVGNQILSGVDIAGTVAAVGSTATLAAAAVPAIVVAPAVIAVAAAAGVAVGLYSIGRSIHTLVDRKLHKQSISLDNSESRRCWLNSTVGAVGATTCAATGLLTTAVCQGTNISKAAQVAFNTLTVVNTAGAGLSVVCSGYNLIQELINKKDISALEVFQLATSILFFHQSVTNFRTAQTIISETQSTTLQNYESTLRSNRHRKLFRKAQLEAQRSRGEVAGNAEVISGIRNINDPDNFFAGLAKVNKDTNKAGAQYTITSDGNVQINSAHVVDPAEFASIGKQNRSTTLNGLPLPQDYSPTPMPKAEFDSQSSLITKCSLSVALKIGTSGCELLMDALNNKLDLSTFTVMLRNFCETNLNYIFDILLNFLDEIGNKLEDFERLYPLVSPAIGMLQFLLKYLHERAHECQLEISELLQTLFDRNGGLITNFLQDIVSGFYEWIERIKSAFQGRLPDAEEWARKPIIALKCSVCSGSNYTRE